MQPNKEIIAFDVDGVIFGSTDECLVIAWNAFQEINGKGDKITSPLEAEKDYEVKFRSIRNYVRSMDEYLVIFYGEFSHKPDQKAFENILVQIDDNLKLEYSKIFYNERKSFKDRFYKIFFSIYFFFNFYFITARSCFWF